MPVTALEKKYDTDFRYGLRISDTDCGLRYGLRVAEPGWPGVLVRPSTEPHRVAFKPLLLLGFWD
jgi:hypothetical protein